MNRIVLTPMKRVFNNFLSYLKFRVINPILGLVNHKIVSTTSLRSWPEFFTHIRSRGFYPNTVIDVGVAAFTDHLYDAFEKSRIILIEPLSEFEPSLKKLTSKYNAEYIIAAAGSKIGELTINVGVGLTDTSMFLMREAEYTDIVQRVVPMTTLDHIDSKKNLEAPILLKIDVQGAELEVLKGARNVIKKCEIIILEAMLIEQYVGQPICDEYVTFMKNCGFVVYEIIGYAYTELDNRLGYLDLVFVKKTGMFRNDERWYGEESVSTAAKDYHGIKRVNNPTDG